MNNPDFGLTKKQSALLKNIFQQFLSQGQVLIYGSRAKGNFHERSDVDLVIKKTNSQNKYFLEKIKTAIEESNFPYLCDIQYFEEMKNPDLKKHIQNVGKIFYEK